MLPYPDLIKELRMEADALPNKFSQNDELFQTLYDAAQAIEKLTAPGSSPEIIYCRDCEYFDGDCFYCEAWNNSPGFPAVSEDMFCCLAKRKEPGI